MSYERDIHECHTRVSTRIHSYTYIHTYVPWKMVARGTVNTLFFLFVLFCTFIQHVEGTLSLK